jgi:hypothetical protein
MSKENSKAIKLVPTSAPSIMIKAVDVKNRPCPTNELTIKQVAVLDCSKLLTPTPEAKAQTGLRTLLDNASRKDPPMTRKMPVRTV